MVDETMSFETTRHLISGLCSLRMSNYLCDVVIISEDGQRFPAHRIILAALSRFFRTMFEGEFLESKQTDVAIRNIKGAVMKMLIEYAYTGEIECPASVENVLSLYVAAHYVQFEEIFRICSDWLKGHVDESNCISMGIVGARYGDSDLLRIADRITAVTISVLAETEDFLLLSAEHLSRIISHDELGVTSEDKVLTILQKWMKHDEEARRAQVETLSAFVRFPLLDFKESSDVLSDLDLVSHYHSSGGSCQRRVGCDGVLLVTGGWEREECESNEADSVCKYVSNRAMLYEPNSNEWTTFPSLELGTHSHKIATSKDVIYSLGGYTQVDSYENDIDIVQRYDAERQRWVDDVQRMHCPRIDFEIVCCDDRIYGMTISKDFVDEMMCEVFDSEKKAWIPISSPENALKGRYILASLANEILAIGFDLNNQFGYTKYDPLENRWCNFKSCQYPLPHDKNLTNLDPHYCCYVTTRDRLYIKGGKRAVIFDSRDEQFSVIDGFFPFSSYSKLAYDIESKRMYALSDCQIVVYDERVNRWDHRDHRDHYLKECCYCDCEVVERKLVLDFV